MSFRYEAEPATAPHEEILTTLPCATRQELRRRRHDHEREREATWGRVRELELLRWRRTVLEGAVLFLAMNLWIFGFSGWALLFSPVLGALAGAGWSAARAEALLSPLIAMPLYAVLALLLRALGAGDGHDQVHALVFGTIAIGPCAMALAVVRSTRLAGE